MWPCITPIDYFPILDPTLKASRASSFPAIRLLDNDIWKIIVGRMANDVPRILHAVAF